MKNVPIKFRGRCWLKGLEPSDIKSSLNDGDYVYGGYAKMKFLFEDDYGDFIIDSNGTAFLVYPDSVAQLVGYDADGNEIYEGDVLVSENEFDYDEGKAVLVPTWTHGYLELDKDTVEDYELRLKKD